MTINVNMMVSLILNIRFETIDDFEEFAQNLDRLSFEQLLNRFYFNHISSITEDKFGLSTLPEKDTNILATLEILLGGDYGKFLKSLIAKQNEGLDVNYTKDKLVYNLTQEINGSLKVDKINYTDYAIDLSVELNNRDRILYNVSSWTKIDEDMSILFVEYGTEGEKADVEKFLNDLKIAETGGLTISTDSSSFYVLKNYIRERFMMYNKFYTGGDLPKGIAEVIWLSFKHYFYKSIEYKDFVVLVKTLIVENERKNKLKWF